MITSIEVNSRKKLDRIVSGLKAQDRHPFYDEFWDEKCRRTYRLYYCTNNFNPKYCPKRCNVAGYKTFEDFAKEVMKEAGYDY